MKEFIYNSWNAIFDHKSNPLRNIPDIGVRHMVLQVLACMWCIVFAVILGSFIAGVYSMILHMLTLAAITITVGTFETAKRKPEVFRRPSSSATSSRGYGGEHE